ncbi:hypothetical protein [Mesorhizobium sp. M4B.F.Ca.ET.089.01.1.1]|uniref:hypothetical protein n=1 Tax=Mesorhizobium sp. M4B.F.Ca.ET.089.01.1.1 TaxID=2496662 RepID=UPI001AED0479|nr:hypothetical protein [Mesorhizobium sp. M4B.F.Ca.ET.089.01.1.1]
MTSIQIDRTDGLSSAVAIKGPVRCASSTNITLSSEQTIDGVAVVSGDRVLVMGQTNPVDNGIWKVSTGVWTRAKDFANNRDVKKGSTVVVTGGTNAAWWQVTTSDPIVIGTTGITFAKLVQPYDADLAAIAAQGTTAYGLSLLLAASAIALAGSLGVIPNAVTNYAADGGGVVSNVTPFTNAGAAGKLTFIPKPATKYAFASNLKGYDIGGAWFPDPTMTWNQLTDAGKFNLYRGRFTNTGANIWRLTDRVFAGEAASKFAGDVNSADGGNSWVKNQADCPWYLPINAGVLWTSGGHDSTVANNSPYGFVAAVKTSTVTAAGIGFGAAIVADRASENAWGYIAEIQREAGTNSVYAFEIDVKNKGANATITPNAQVVGTYGLWVVAGGDNIFGGSAANPSTAGLVFLKNAHTWNSGIVFMKDSLTAGEAMALSSEGTGGAHRLNWYNAAGNVVFNVVSSATDTVAWSLNRINGNLQVAVGGTQAFAFSSASAPANSLTFSSAATTVAPSVASTGSDTNIDLALVPKGTGAVIPTTNDAAALGKATVSWSDLFLASGGVLNWNNGNYTITHSAGLLSCSGSFTAAGGLSSQQNILSVSPTHGMGYATGAGGTVTQATSKSTGVTLNKITGQVTMNNAALAAGTIVSFVLTNSAIAATDILVLNHISAGTPGSYSLNARAAAGSATIDVRNNTAGSLSEAIVISYAVVKAVTA